MALIKYEVHEGQDPVYLLTSTLPNARPPQAQTPYMLNKRVSD